MRELTWKEKIIDSQCDNAISKWAEALEDLLGNLFKIDHLYLITLKRGERFKVKSINLSEDDPEDDTPCIEFMITYDLPKLVDEAKQVFAQLLQENGLNNYIFAFDEEKLSICVEELI